MHAERIKNELIEWVRDWFEKNGKGCNAVLGISGGKDSTVAAAICVEALGKDRVIGVLIPNGIQSDISDSVAVCEFLGIKNITVNIKDAYDSILGEIKEGIYEPQRDGYVDVEITKQAKENLPPRLRMATLYAVSQCMNGRVVNTGNLSENVCGYSTIYGDHAGDFAPFDMITATEVVKIGHLLGLPDYLVDKTPSDGLCGKTDEDSLGFTYKVLDNFIRTGECKNKETLEKIKKRFKNSRFKAELIRFPHYDPQLPDFTGWAFAEAKINKEE